MPRKVSANRIDCIDAKTFARVVHTLRRLMASRQFTMSMCGENGEPAIDLSADLSSSHVHHFTRICTGCRERSREYIEVYACPVPTKIGVNHIRTVVAKAEEATNFHGVKVFTLFFISHEVPTPFALKHCDMINAKKDSILRIETWTFSQLSFPIVDHFFQPTFHVLTRREEEAMMENGPLSNMQIGLMLTSDPVARWYGLQRGKIMRIDRGMPSGTTMRVFRRVV